MERVVFDAVKSGSLHRLKILLDSKSDVEIAVLVSSKTDGVTPLVVASLHGHLDVALYLIKDCHVDVEQVGSIIFYETSIDEATPLWCAAAAGHLDLVKLLIKYKASVNCATEEKPAPLLAACFNENFIIAKYLIEHGANIEISDCFNNTCLIIASDKGHCEFVEYLLYCGADVNRKTLKGHTALHGAAESGNLDIVKLLLRNSSKFDCDFYGITPFLTAANAGHINIVEYFVQEMSFTKYDIINALDLIGAAYMYIEGDIPMALSSWQRAMTLRYEDKENPLNKPAVQSSLASYVDAAEVCTFLQLEELQSDPEKLGIQALLVKERILGSAHPDTCTCIMYLGSIYADNYNSERCIQLWMYSLDVQQKVQDPLSDTTYDCFLVFTELFIEMMANPLPLIQKNAANTFHNMLKVLKEF